ncbi:MAG: hypothetical protein ACKVT2_22990 [Saprospiraceae bacterium]
MKYFSLFLFFAIVFGGSSAYAQRNSLSLGFFYLPKTETTKIHGSVGYFRGLEGRHAIGVKAMFSDWIVGSADQKRKVYIGNIDFVNRWTFKERAGPSKLNLEAGLSISGIKTNEKNPYFYRYCGTGMTEEMMREIERKIRRQYDIIPHYGIASAASWEFALAPFLGIGVGTTFNMYYAPGDGWLFLLLPNFNVAYNF